ncbi:hypothetical protein HanHA300_Chr09g0338611 [Helianthus annuus]|nr:hypothetical protein HanHA300_Chr09g0338611 [Helianthus annuus]KAJ0544289.1 hypothetical protein HanHA89_Chr09g0359921 [Helianthus annuus]KAJ0709295.1 hypothetical protein HanLR1_Chr09g0338701 [Helianthus annuus]KAJ0713172.1 hypothetical protein HanOQP8_Chr09g0342841 [Helianthus annuus]
MQIKKKKFKNKNTCTTFLKIVSREHLRREAREAIRKTPQGLEVALHDIWAKIGVCRRVIRRNNQSDEEIMNFDMIKRAEM